MFFSRTKQYEYAFVCDIGSDSISGAYIKRYFEEDRKPVIVWMKRVSLSNISSSQKKNLGSKGVLISALKKLVVAADNFRVSSHIDKPERAHITLSSPWYVSETHREIVHHKNPVTFTEKDFDFIVEQSAENLEEKASQKTPLLKDYFSKGHHVIEKHLIDIKVNGYSVADPFGKSVRELSLNYYLTLIPTDLHQEIFDLLDDAWHNIKLSFSSFSLTHYLVAKNTGHLGENIMFVDVTGSATEITKILDGSISGTEHVMLGKAHFRKTIELSLGMESYMANSMLELYVKKELSNTDLANLSLVLKDIETKWQKMCIDHIEKEHVDGYGCTEYILSSDPDFMPYYENLIFKTLKQSEVSLGCTPTISTIDQYNEMVVYDDGIKEDSFLSLSVVYSSHLGLQR